MPKNSQYKITDFFHVANTKNPRITDYFPRLSGIKKYQSNQHYFLVRTFAQNFLKKCCNDYKPNAYRTRKGYFFIADNNFQEYSVYLAIDKVVMEKGVYNTKRAGLKVGEATIDNNSALSSIEIYQEHRRNGIGTELIRFIKHCDGQFHVHCGIENNSRYRLTEEGAKLIHACVNKKILTEDDLLAGVPTSPQYSGFY